MKLLSSIFFSFALVIAFVALPSSNAFACGGSCCKKEQQEVKKDKEIKEKSCCCKKKKDNKEEKNDKKGCGGDCGSDGCHCSSSTFSFGAATLICQISLQSVATDFYLPKTNWYFDEKMPNSVYLSVWLPPKISC